MREMLSRDRIAGAAAAVLLVALLVPLAAPPAVAQYRDRYDERYEEPYDEGYDDRDSRSYDGRGDDSRSYDEDRDAPDVTYFYDELDGEGRWVSHPVYGEVFIPHGIDDGWRPYARGHWVYTDEHGWYWMSDERFGWATYHYGRWHLDERYGWVWVPGTTWAPAWVAWRSSDDYVGWAPLPPETYWDRRRGLVYDDDIYEAPRFGIYWSFVETRYVTSPGLHRYFAPRHEYSRIIYRTRPRTEYVYVGNRIVNRGIPLRDYERVTHSRVERYHLDHSDRRDWRGAPRAEGRNIRAYRPNLTRSHVEQVRRDSGRLPPQVGPGTTWGNVDRRPLTGTRSRPNPKVERARPDRDSRPAARSVRPRLDDNDAPRATAPRGGPAGAGSTFAPPVQGRATAKPPYRDDPPARSGNAARSRPGGDGEAADPGPRRKKPVKRAKKPDDAPAAGGPARKPPPQVGAGTSFGGAGSAR